MSGESPSGVDSPRWFWIGVAVGGLLIAVGVRGLLDEAVPARGYLLWFLGFNIAHDAVVVPVVAALVWVAHGRRSAIAVFALLAAGATVVFSVPFVLGRGRIPRSPSVLPLDYAAGLTWALSGIVVGALAVAAVTHLFRRRAATRAPTAPDRR